MLMTMPASTGARKQSCPIPIIRHNTELKNNGTTRWGTNLPSKVNLHHEIDFRAVLNDTMAPTSRRSPGERILRGPPSDWCPGLENNCFTEMCSSSEAGSYLKLIDICITELWA